MTKQYDNFAGLITFTRASTGTYLDSDGLLKTATTNTPRIEFDINGNRKGILIEEARTNLQPNSNDANAVFWGINGVTVTSAASVGVDGGLTAQKLVETATTGVHQNFASPNLAAATTFTFSRYLKAGERNVARFAFSSPAMSDASSEFNLSTGTVIFGPGTIENAGNGWYRCSLSFTTVNGGASTLRTQIVSVSGATYTGDGTSGIFVFGAQLEAGSFPTSYIPTAGAAASRSADVAHIPTSAFGYNAKVGSGGTVIADFQSDNWQYGTGFYRVWEFDGSVNNGLFHAAANLNQFRYRLNDSGGTAVLGATTMGSVTATASAGAKIAIAYAPDDFAVYANGSQAETDNAGLFANEIVTQIAIGGGSFGTPSNGHIKSLSYFPRRLTNSQLQRLTS